MNPVVHPETDSQSLAPQRDVRGLIRKLGSRDQDRVTEAVHALGALGPDATLPLVAALSRKNRDLRLGIISALAEIRDTRAVPSLVSMLQDQNSEVRWQAAISLGEISDSRAAAPLIDALHDSDKYVRYGSAVALMKIGYQPGSDGEWAWYFAGVQDWQKLRESGHAGLAALFNLLQDKDSEVRVQAVRTLGGIGDPDAGPVLLRTMSDENRQVRWEAVLASRACGVRPERMPRALFSRPRTTKSPLIAGFLNFMLPGLGYGYLGKWWGIMIFQIDITVTVWLFKVGGEFITYLVLLSLYIILALHAWYITATMPEDPP